MPKQTRTQMLDGSIVYETEKPPVQKGVPLPKVDLICPYCGKVSTMAKGHCVTTCPYCREDFFRPIKEDRDER